MDNEQLNNIKNKFGVVLHYVANSGQIAIEGKRSAVALAHAHIAHCRDEVAAALRREMGLPDPDDEIVTLTVPARSVPSLAVQWANYLTWCEARGRYHTPTPEQLDAMKRSPEIQEGDELLPDFAHSVTVRKADGLLIAVNRKGIRCDVPTYSPYRDGVAK